MAKKSPSLGSILWEMAKILTESSPQSGGEGRSEPPYPYTFICGRCGTPIRSGYFTCARCGKKVVGD